jgi:hypothetical protein
MASQWRQVVVNLDLDDRLFPEAVRFLELQKVFPAALLDLNELASFGPSLLAEGFELVVLYARRADAFPSSLGKAIDRIESTTRVLEHIQLRHAVRKITLVDCGEIPTAPLSDFSAVAQYLETFANDMSADASARVFALDHDFFADEPSAKLYDTQSSEFIDHFVAYTKTSLQMLNTGFGSGKLPD